MLDDYLKRLENMIVPTVYDKNNFMEKIRGDFEDPLEEKKKSPQISNQELLSKIQNEDDKRLLEEYMIKMSQEKNVSSSENKFKIYEKILENEVNQENPLQIDNNNLYNKTQRTLSMSPSRKIRMSQTNLDEDSLRQKVHMLNIKNMNYRYEVETQKNRILDLNKRIEEQQMEIERQDKQRETSNKYLIKLEGLVSGSNLDKGFIPSNTSSKTNSSNFMSNLNPNKAKSENFIVDFNKTKSLVIEDKVNNTKLNFSDKNEMKDFILNLMNENQKLKSFQQQVYEISKNYDELNDQMIDTMKEVQKVLTSDKPNNSFDKNEMAVNFDKIINNVQKTLEIKQNEYVFLVDSKDRQILFLQEEVTKLNDNLDMVRRDRIRDQKMINEYETEINFLNSRVQESRSQGVFSENRQKEMNQNLKMEKKIAPAKNTVNKIVKKFERTFDLQDKNNVKMITNINKNIK